MQEAFSTVHTIRPFNGGLNAYSNHIDKHSQATLQNGRSTRNSIDYCFPSVEPADGNLCLQVGSGERPWESMEAWMPKGCDKMPSHALASSVPWQRASNGPLHYRYASLSQHTTDFVKPGVVGIC